MAKLSYRLPVPFFILVVLAFSMSAVAAKDKSFDFTKTLIDSFSPEGKDDRWPHLGTLHEWSIEVDTYNNDVKSSQIGLLYLAVCRKLEANYGKKLQTYFAYDGEGYPSQISIVQVSSGQQNAIYLMVGIFNGNDADSFTFALEQGTFTPGNRKPKTSWAIPDDLLRKDSPTR